jgi:hypothetical protein
MSPRRVIRHHGLVACFALALLGSACEASEHGNPEHPLPDGGADSGGFGNAPSADMLGGSCELTLWPRPDVPRTRYQCEVTGGEGSAAAWRCSCGDRVETQPWQSAHWEEGSCERILAESCEIDLDQPNFCEHDSGGSCWPDPEREDGWDCACGSASDPATLADSLQPVTAPSCAEAAFAHCASECEDVTGSCTPSTEGDRFLCECDYYAATRDTPAARCEQALAGCDPQALDVRDAPGLACSTFAGFCDQTDAELRCICADGSEHVLPLTDLSERSGEACEGELHELCGDGSAQREAFYCSLEKADGRQCYASVRFADQRYDCTCQSESSCNEEYDIRTSELEAATCEEALTTCSTADDAFERLPPPACTPDPGPRNCTGPARDDRTCHAALLTDGHYRCQCFLDDGLTEHDIWEQEVEAPDCDAALNRCVELDP